MGIAVIINWYGPYSDKANLAAEMKANWRKGARCLYMALGSDGAPHYIGRTENPAARLANHEKMAHPGNVLFYCAEIDSQGVSGPRRRTCQQDLAAAEAALICALKPKQNDRGLARTPDDCVVVYSRFYDSDEGEARVEPPPRFPLFIAYDAWTDRWDAGVLESHLSESSPMGAQSE